MKTAVGSSRPAVRSPWPAVWSPWPAIPPTWPAVPPPWPAIPPPWPAVPHHQHPLAPHPQAAPVQQPPLGSRYPNSPISLPPDPRHRSAPAQRPPSAPVSPFPTFPAQQPISELPPPFLLKEEVLKREEEDYRGLTLGIHPNGRHPKKRPCNNPATTAQQPYPPHWGPSWVYQQPHVPVPRSHPLPPHLLSHPLHKPSSSSTKLG